MLMSDSMPLLWLVYVVLSLVVLLTGYLGLGFLPRLPRLVITWAVAGVMWTPSHFRLPLLDEGEFYSGFAPAVMVAAVAFLDNNREIFLPVALLVAVGAGVGALLGLLLWWRGRGRGRAEGAEGADGDEATPAADRRRARREPVVG